MTDHRAAGLLALGFLLGLVFDLAFRSPAIPPHLADYAPGYCARQPQGGAYYDGDVSAMISCERNWRATLESVPPKDKPQ